MSPRTRTYRVGCKLDYHLSEESTFILNVAVARSPCQRIDIETLSVTPRTTPGEHLNERTFTRYHRFGAPAGTLTVNYEASMTCASHDPDPGETAVAPPDRLPLPVITYLYPSRYCQSDLLLRLTQMEFGHLPAGYAKVQEICDWMRRNVEYLSGTTGPLTSAFDTATQRAGVCRDFSHLAIAFCRASNIPARFVSGYALGLEPQDFHAMFEAWIGDGWYLFDPTGQIAPGNLVRIGCGRDAADVSFAFIFGPAFMTEMAVWCRPGEQVPVTERPDPGGDAARRAVPHAPGVAED